MNLACLPFCYARPSTYDDEAPGCAVCSVRASCRSNAQLVLAKVALRVDVSDLQARFLKEVQRHAVLQPGETTHQPARSEERGDVIERSYGMERVTYTLTDDDLALIARLPKKVAAKARVLMEKGIDIVARQALHQGRNPFAERGDRPLYVAAELLLAGGFTRERLRSELQARYAWSYHSAASNVSQVVALLTAFGIAQEGNKLLTLVPPSDTHDH